MRILCNCVGVMRNFFFLAGMQDKRQTAAAAVLLSAYSCILGRDPKERWRASLEAWILGLRVFAIPRNCIQSVANRTRFFGINVDVALFVDSAIEAVKQVRCFNSKRFAYSQKGPDCNWPASFDLLPVACGESVTDHIFLRITVGFA